ncbi:hypothetical protein C4F40_00135 [Sphingobacterium sp. Ka21]|uniref:Lantibiotic dehydratase n=2 Tax=Sphingobacterium pedocola TaxID=2082722 RepID=A0ABR9T1B8_9SPHI|nr:hypothetical protein [Sphingobacterium pedocola]
MSNFSCFDFYLLRSPKLSLETISELFALTSMEQLDFYFRQLYMKRDLKEALLLASPEFYTEIEKWLTGEQILTEKLLKTLYKYTVRMGMRCTPYGLFAGISMGRVAKETSEKTSMYRNGHHSARFRLDMQCLTTLTQLIAADPMIKTHLKYFKNNTIYRQGDFYKFYQHKPSIHGVANYLSAARSTVALDYLLTVIKNGANYSELVQKLCEKGASRKQASDFVDQIIDSQLLVSELQPNVTGADFFDLMMKKIILIDREQRYTPTLKRVDYLLKSDRPILERQQEIELLLSRKFPKIHFKHLLQGDQLTGMHKNTLGKMDMENLIQQLQQLLPLSTEEVQYDLEQFKKDFLKRYEGRMVSLLEVLDPDTGIGYGNSSTAYRQQDDLLHDIDIHGTDIKKSIADSPNLEIILQKYLESVEHNYLEISLQESDIQAFQKIKKEAQSFPSTFYAMGNLLEDNEGGGTLRFHLAGCGGSSAGNLISRFGDLDDALQSKLKDIGKAEQANYPNAILAEIVHLPEARTGNILQRPTIRKAEIGLLAQCSPDVSSIKASDLYLFIQNHRLVLWSKQLQTEIIPRLTSAHNYQGGINLYRFLGDLQSQQNHLNIKWEWGKLRKQPFLPRVRYKDIILSRARWNVPQLLRKSSAILEDEIIMGILQKKYHIPKQAVLTEGDNELLLDFSHPLSVKVFLERLSKGDVVLQEFLFSDYRSPLNDGRKNTYANEVIIPLRTEGQNNQPVTPPLSSTLRRAFPLGTEWVHVNIYCGPQYAEKLLQGSIPHLIQHLKEKQILNKWFFIRYNHPEHHIRLRIEGKSANDFGSIVQIIQNVFSPMLQAEQISNIQFDTYVREIERYHADCMEMSEELFFRDSEYALEILQKFPLSRDRWRSGMLGIEQILNEAGYSLEEKRDFAERMRIAFAKEFGNNKANDKKFNEKFRDRKKHIEAVLLTQQQDDIPTGCLKKRSLIVKKIFASMESPLQDHPLINKRNSLLSSYIHMFINRLFAYDQRLHEFAIYHLLSNYYRMQVGKEKSLQLV